MSANILNNDIQQYFEDTTYLYISPTIKKFKLFVLSGFNLKEKKTHIYAYGLIPDEKYEIFYKFFNVLKNIYKFIPKNWKQAI